MIRSEMSIERVIELHEEFRETLAWLRVNKRINENVAVELISKSNEIDEILREERRQKV